MPRSGVTETISDAESVRVVHPREDTCSCSYCQNLIDEIRATYPQMASFLDSIGVNIERPFEASLAYESPKGFWEYSFVQYLVAGDSKGFENTTINGMPIYIQPRHPEATYKGEHFIIETGPIYVKIRNDKYIF